MFLLTENVNKNDVSIPPILDITNIEEKKKYMLKANKSIPVAISPKMQKSKNFFETFMGW